MKHSNWWKRMVNRSQQAQRRLRSRPEVEQLEARCLLSVTTASFRPISEVGNNIADPNLGIAGTNLLRISPADYKPVANGGDGLNTPSMAYGAPNFVAGPRLVSNDVSNQATVLFGSTDINTVNQNKLSAFGYTWGQFIDHDMDLTPDQGGQPLPAPPNTNKDGGNGFPIPKDPNQPTDPIGSLAFSRSLFDPTTGITTPREQINVSTSYLDLSQVYGSTDAVATALRSFSGGQLKSSPGADGKIGTKDDLLPYNNSTYFSAVELSLFNMANAAHLVASTALFVAGDPRANETTELTALQTLFMRNHNLIARQLQKEHPRWSDEQLYQTARKINIAEEQIITYEGYLPALLGPDALPAYTGYDASVDPSISTEFSTIGFRFGHSLLNNNVERHGNNGLDIQGDPTGDATLRLAFSFFNPTLLSPNGVVDPLTGHISSDISAVLKGDADISAQAMDVMAVSDIRNLLFGQGGPGEDLIARDIWRADDHGIGTYNQVRAAYGLPLITDDATHGFGQITSDVAVQQKLLEAFTGPTREAFLANGKFAGDINPFIAGLAEGHVPGSDMGPLFTKILVDQFTRLRDGDRFFYLNQKFTAEERSFVKRGDRLAEVIKSNTKITNLQKDVFIFEASISGKVEVAQRRGHGGRGQAGITVQLTDSRGIVVATAVTDDKGRYTFNQFNGVSSTGTYKVSVLVPAGLKQVTRDPGTIKISAGDAKVKKVNFGLAPLNPFGDRDDSAVST